MKTTKPFRNCIATTVTALTLGAGLTGTARASEGSEFHGRTGDDVLEVHPSGEPAPLSPAQVVSKLQAAGYTEVREIEQEHDFYEVKARDVHGRRLELYVDTRSGDVVKRKHDD